MQDIGFAKTADFMIASNLLMFMVVVDRDLCRNNGTRVKLNKNVINYEKNEQNEEGKIQNFLNMKDSFIFFSR